MGKVIQFASASQQQSHSTSLWHMNDEYSTSLMAATMMEIIHRHASSISAVAAVIGKPHAKQECIHLLMLSVSTVAWPVCSMHGRPCVTWPTMHAWLGWWPDSRSCHVWHVWKIEFSDTNLSLENLADVLTECFSPHQGESEDSSITST